LAESESLVADEELGQVSTVDEQQQLLADAVFARIDGHGAS
jgi:hypothetical protein